MGILVGFPGEGRIRGAPRAWRAGDSALAGASHVRIAVIDGGTALVVGEALCGSWSIWIEVSKLKRIDWGRRPAPLGGGDPLVGPGGKNRWRSPAPGSGTDSRMPITEQIERRDREMRWENEGGRARAEERFVAAGGAIAADKGAGAPGC